MDATTQDALASNLRPAETWGLDLMEAVMRTSPGPMNSPALAALPPTGRSAATTVSLSPEEPLAAKGSSSRTADPGCARVFREGTRNTKRQFLDSLVLGALLLSVLGTSGCSFVAPYTTDRVEFDAEVRSWGLLGVSEEQAKQALLAHGMHDAVRVYPCTQSVRPDCAALPYLKNPPGPPYIYAERKQSTGIFCARTWWVAVYLDTEGRHTQRLADGIRDGENGCIYP